jgi:hypothetical protein
MESFRAALDRLTREFFAQVFNAVRDAAREQVAERQPKVAKSKAATFVRSRPAAVAEPRPVVLRSFDIPVGVPRRRRRRAASATPAVKKAAAPPPPPPPQVVKFEVVPHPERKNRRIVLTRLDTAETPPPSSETT